MTRRIGGVIVVALAVAGMAGCGSKGSDGQAPAITSLSLAVRVDQCNAAVDLASTAVKVFVLAALEAHVSAAVTASEAATRIRDASTPALKAIDIARSACALPECPAIATTDLDWLKQMTLMYEDSANRLDGSPQNGVKPPEGLEPRVEPCPSS
jgi:hypothetical protein